jgi:hypothetical protein
MRIARGFFRLWVVIAGLYVAIGVAIAATSYKAMKPLLWAPRYEFKLQNGTSRVIDTSRPRSESQDVFRTAYREDTDLLRRAGKVEEANQRERDIPRAETVVDGIYAEAEKATAEAQSRFLEALMWIFLPPLGLLLLGYLASWVARGFRAA